MRRLWLTAFLGLFFASSLWAGEPKHVLLIGQGPDGHPKGAHEYFDGLKILEAILKKTSGLEVKIVNADEPWRDGPDLLAKADGVVLYLAEGAKWVQQVPARHEALKKLAARGGGIVVLHWAMGTREAKYIDGFLDLAGGCHGGPDRKYQILQAQAKIADVKHPITTGIADFPVRDEFYYSLKFSPTAKGVTPIIKTAIDGKDETVAWAWNRPDGGRSFGFSGLHFHENWRMPEYRRLVAQGVLWSQGLAIPKDGLKVNVERPAVKSPDMPGFSNLPNRISFWQGLTVLPKR